MSVRLSVCLSVWLAVFRLNYTRGQRAGREGKAEHSHPTRETPAHNTHTARNSVRTYWQTGTTHPSPIPTQTRLSLEQPHSSTEIDWGSCGWGWVVNFSIDLCACFVGVLVRRTVVHVVCVCACL
uniref:Secreted protein n=1 Tax=Vitrella brassicaformis TaxID=1169539 RepID=A0A7S1JU93_9ALVE|mmetsp:Transcript_25128/g.62212  ORF Transcript_25128/g.62212 Transcript_25128/m.62212 type:complete len:125 (+) Transcript_25128:277-651(+)